MDNDTNKLRERIASAIANARGGRRGMPQIKNVLDMLSGKLRDELLDDADAVLAVLAQPQAAQGEQEGEK